MDLADQRPGGQGDDRALFGISVAAELAGVTPQMLRSYESKGLVQPSRTEGGTRRYSGHDLNRVQRITTLLAAGLNLAGVEHVLALEAETDRLRDELAARTDQPTHRSSPRRRRKE